MNTYEIENTVAKDKCISRIFLGVFPSDSLPTIREAPTCFIANTDPSNKPGQHWIAMYFDKYTEYFDSYGLSPSEPFRKLKPEIFSVHCLQNIGSVVCGEYCIYYLHKRTRGCPLDRIVAELGKRSDSDTVVKVYTDKLRICGAASNCQSCLPRK